MNVFQFDEQRRYDRSRRRMRRRRRRGNDDSSAGTSTGRGSRRGRPKSLPKVRFYSYVHILISVLLFDKNLH